jgi:toxin-antitoxin system PIN domain toxin
VILVDANLLIYAIDRDSPQHRRALAFVEKALSSSEPVGFAWVVVLAFLRLITRAGILRRPLPPSTALEHVAEWLELPNVELVTPGEDHFRIFRNLIDAAGTAGNLTSDAHLAALAIEKGATLCSADHDFARFPGLRYVNPLAGTARHPR